MDAFQALLCFVLLMKWSTLPIVVLVTLLTLLIFVYLVSMFQVVLYFLHSTSALSFYIDVVLTLSIIMEIISLPQRQ